MLHTTFGPTPGPKGTYEVFPPYKERAFTNPNPPQIAREEMRDDFSTNVKYTPTLESLCAPIELDDSTYKAMKINFDDAVLHETLKLKGNSRNIPKPRKMHPIL